MKYKHLFLFCRDFLPRGSGIVTRRPLVLQLINSNTGKNSPVDQCKVWTGDGCAERKVAGLIEWQAITNLCHLCMQIFFILFS